MNISEVRNACYRVKNGNRREEHKSLLESIEKQFEPSQNWSNFVSEWDMLISKEGVATVIKPEKDIAAINRLILEYAIHKKLGSTLEMTPLQQNIIFQVEQMMLDKIMNWSNYNVDWGVKFYEHTPGRIETIMYNTASDQILVSDEMIANSKIGDGAEIKKTPENILVAKKMTPDQELEFKKFMEKKNKDNK
jgi:hypothetical protein